MEKIEEFYKLDGREDLRLSKDGPHYLEYLTAIKYMDKFIAPGSAVLDNCAGTGIYAFRLAEQGHTVTAGDIVRRNVELIQEKQRETGALAGVYLGDARKMPKEWDTLYDAVLCMGALYHLPERADRKQVLSESLRVLKKYGLVIFTYMNRHAVILNNASGNLDNIDEILSYTKNGVEGVFYASTPEEMTEMAAAAGIEMLAHAALDGIACFMGQTTNTLNKKGLERWQRYHFASCETPSLLGYSYHNIFIGRKC